jgi:hypothetical protein
MSDSQRQEDHMRCCGNPPQEIMVQAGAGLVALVRCSSCGDQQWTRDGAEVARGEAFELLATAYRGVPLRARAARDRAAAVTAARLASRVAERAAIQTHPDTRAEAGRLIDMLHGWQVLGATA